MDKYPLQWKKQEQEKQEQKITEINKMNRKTLYYIKQKLIGILLIVLSVVSAKLTGDGTASLFFVPAGIYVTLTKEAVVVGDYANDRNKN